MTTFEEVTAEEYEEPEPEQQEAPEETSDEPEFPEGVRLVQMTIDRAVAAPDPECGGQWLVNDAIEMKFGPAECCPPHAFAAILAGLLSHMQDEGVTWDQVIRQVPRELVRATVLNTMHARTECRPSRREETIRTHFYRE